MARSLAGWVVGSLSLGAAFVASLCVSSCEQSVDVDLRQCPGSMQVGERAVIGFALDASEDVTTTEIRLDPADTKVVALIDDTEECTVITSVDGQPDGPGDCTKRFPNRSVTVVGKGVGTVTVVASAEESDGDRGEDACTIFVSAGTGGGGGGGDGGGGAGGGADGGGGAATGGSGGDGGSAGGSGGSGGGGGSGGAPGGSGGAPGGSGGTGGT